MAKVKKDLLGRDVYKIRKQKNKSMWIFHKGTMEEFIDEDGNTKVSITFPWKEEIFI